jgi:hypothetical protein
LNLVDDYATGVVSIRVSKELDMSCWVVPAVAAEFWQMPVDQVMAKLASGDLVTKEEHGFTLIDVAPNSPRQPATNKTVYPPAPSRPVQPPLATPRHESQLPDAVEHFSNQIEHDTFGDYRLARIQTARLRKPPESRFLN